MKEEINITYLEIEEKIINHEIYQNIKDYSNSLISKIGKKYSTSLLYNN